jgi:hypothetical protein
MRKIQSENKKNDCTGGSCPGRQGPVFTGSLFAVRVAYPFLDNPFRGPAAAVVVPALGGGTVVACFFLIVIVLVFSRRGRRFFRYCRPDGLLRVAPVVVPPSSMTGVVPPVVPPLPGSLALRYTGLLPGLLLRWRLR